MTEPSKEHSEEYLNKRNDILVKIHGYPGFGETVEKMIKSYDAAYSLRDAELKASEDEATHWAQEYNKALESISEWNKQHEKDQLELKARDERIAELEQYLTMAKFGSVCIDHLRLKHVVNDQILEITSLKEKLANAIKHLEQLEDAVFEMFCTQPSNRDLQAKAYQIASENRALRPLKSDGENKGAV